MKGKPKASVSLEQSHADLGEKKGAFLAAARAVDFLEPLRKHPFSTVGAAALAGAVVGSHRGGTPGNVGQVATKAVTRSFSKLLPLISSLIQGYMAVRQQAHQASADHEATAHQQPSGSTPSDHSAASAAEAVSYS